MAETEAGPPEGPPDAPKASRAGRNLPAAIAVGVVMGGSLIAILLFAPYVWLGVLAVAAPIATLEVTWRFREAGYDVPIIPLLIGGQAMIWLTYPYRSAGALGAFGGTVVVCMIWRLVRQGRAAGSDVAAQAAPTNYFRDISMTVFLATWVPLFMSFGALLIYQDHGAGRVFTLMLTVVFSDIGGYTAGVLFGKHLMVPAISPKKSWEGLGGSLLFGIAASVVAVVTLLDKPAWVALPLGLMLVLTGTLGDLVESQVKRDLGIKDMGTLLPGHGGLMDRIDGMLPSAVATWIVLTLLA